MIRHDRAGLVKPEMGELREHDPFERNPVGQDAIERRDAIGGDQEQTIAEIEDVTDFAALEFPDAAQINLEQRICRRCNWTAVGFHSRARIVAPRFRSQGSTGGAGNRKIRP